MPDTRRHRGPHPEDRNLFSEETWDRLQDAVADQSWLLTRGYTARASLKLVGDRLQLAERQRRAVLRSSCSDQSLSRRRRSLVRLEEVGPAALWIDGFNVLTSVEAALAGGIILRGRDGCYRDMASMHGSYRKVAETLPAARAIGQTLACLCPAARICWWLDRPVSNSGRLRSLLGALARQESWDWQIELADNPDALLARGEALAATADGVVLDQCRHWVNLARVVIARCAPQLRPVPMSLLEPGHATGQ
jgi:hypothetical protein